MPPSNRHQKVTIDQLLAIIRELDAAARARVARVLAESEIDARFDALIRQLANKPPADDISDVEIQAEVDAVRTARAHTMC